MALPILLLASVALLAFATYKYVVYPAFVSPLSRIPAAHPTAHISPAWILWTRWQMRNNAATLAAHRKHGPVVRLAPNEISVNCVDGGIRTVYMGGWEKHDWYPRLFPSYGVMNMFSIMEHGPHSAKKRLLSNIYSKSYLQNSAQMAANSLVLMRDRFLPLIGSAADSATPVDVHDMHNGFTMDFMSAYQFGLRSSTRFSVHVKERHGYLRPYHSRKPYEFYSQEVPQLKKWSRWLGCPVIPEYVEKADDYIEDWGMGMCEKADGWLEESERGADLAAGDEPIVYGQFKRGMTKQWEKEKNGNFGRENGYRSETESQKQQRLEVASEMLDHLGAGHETSAIALTYLLYEMSLRPTLQAQLRQEVLTLSPAIIWPPATTPSGGASDFDLPSSKSIDALPILHAIVMETLRVHTPIPGIEPRVSPSVPGGSTLGNYSGIPAGVRVSAMPYTLHRNEDVYPEPESWKPERWLEANEEASKEMMRWFWAFGSGGRMCIGSHLAMQEIKLIVAAIYTNWRTVIVDDTGIEGIDAYTTRPTSNQCILRFERA